MATANQVHEAIRAQPFRPFVIRLADGRHYTVDHQELAMLGRNGMELLFVADDEGIHQIYAPLIVEIETPGARPARPRPPETRAWRPTGARRYQ